MPTVARVRLVGLDPAVAVTWSAVVVSVAVAAVVLWDAVGLRRRLWRRLRRRLFGGRSCGPRRWLRSAGSGRWRRRLVNVSSGWRVRCLRRGGRRSIAAAAAATAGDRQGGERNHGRSGQDGDGFAASHVTPLSGVRVPHKAPPRAPICRRPGGDSLTWDRGGSRACRLLPGGHERVGNTATYWPVVLPLECLTLRPWLAELFELRLAAMAGGR
jgi:hypothetical protein